MDSVTMTLLETLYSVKILEWSASILYKSGDIVTYKNQVYKSFGNNKGEVPVTSKNWISIK